MTGSDPLHAWALPQRRRIIWSEGVEISVAPAEYVVLRKLAFYREGRSGKHLADIRAIREITGVDEAAMAPWLERRGLAGMWREIKTAP